jgi:hypothetical protein
MIWLRVLFALVLSGAFLHEALGQASQPDKKKDSLKKQESTKAPGKPSATEKKPAAETPGKQTSVDKMELPSGAILVLVKDLNEALQKQGIVLISPETFRAMQARIATLEKKFKEEKRFPHSCKLSGNIDGDHVFLQADFAFHTDTPQRTVVLGLQGGNLTDEGELDRQPPILDHGPEGYTVQVEKPGSHQLTLKLKVPVGLKRTGTPGGGSERGFELGLPGAAVTLLSLEVPAAVKEIRWNDRLEKRPEAARRGRWELALGKIKNLSLSWKEPAALPGNASLLTADGDITVKVEEEQLVTSAELQLGDLRGQAREWHLLLPPQAKVDIKAPAGVVPEIIPPPPNGLVHIIRLKEPTSERLHLSVQVSQPRPFAQARQPIGPFTLLDAFEQQGTISIKAPPKTVRGYRLLYHRRGDVYQREVSGQPGSDVVAQFRYEKLPNPGKSVAAAQAGTWAPLDVELRREKTQVETQVEHVIRVSRVSPTAEGWQADLTTKIKVWSLSAGVDFVDVQLPLCHPEGLAVLSVYPYPALPWAPLYLATKKNWPVIVPADFTCQSESGSSPELQAPDPQRRARIVLNRPDAKEVTLVLTGKYLLPDEPRRARLELPRPVGNLDRGGKLAILVGDQLELLFGDPQVEETVRGQHQRTFSLDAAPRQAEFGWRAYRPDFPVTAVTDITVHGRNAHVHHELRCKFPEREAGPQGKSGGQVLLRVPPAVRALRIITHEARLDPRKGLAWVSIPADQQAAKPIVVEYDLTLPAIPGEVPGQPNERMTGSFSVPLIWPEQSTRIDGKVRIWCDPGIVPLLDDAPDPVWRDRGSEVAGKDKDSLPSLVLHASGLDLPLRLRLLAARSNLPPVVIDKGLVQVDINEEGAQHYRVRFLLSKLNSDHLKVKFPAAVTDVIQAISLNNKRIDDWLPLAADNRTVRLPVRPDLYDRPAILEFEYKLPTSVTEGDRIGQTTLFPPEIEGAGFQGRVRWQLFLSSGEVVLVEGPHVQAEYRWEFRNWLLTPEPGAGTEDLERWLTVESTDRRQAASVVFWRTLLQPLRIWHFPRLVWFTLCSATVLVIGLGLSFASVSRLTFWFLIAVVAVAAMAAGLLWPALLPPVVYGAQPGLVVLLVILALQWMLQERYRRQVVFMPGFTRLKANSSLIVNTPSRPREASTVDAPGTGGSGVSGKKP